MHVSGPLWIGHHARPRVRPRWEQLPQHRSGDSFAVPAADLAHIAGLLRAAAGHRRMPADWAGLARELADAAQSAANTRRPWEWT
ncbi:DUF7739 domain-containing protein [Streptomyces sp. NPDC054786]